MSCLDDNQVIELVEGRLDDRVGAEIDAHLDECAACRDLVAAAVPPSSPLDDTSLDGAPEPTRPSLRPGVLLSRYVILRTVGAGGMGVVYAAHDPELDRKVAIKLLRPLPASDRDELSTRVLREAQSMARLTHPNVVAVHDVGSVDGQVFIVMEFVDGTTLRQWLEARDRPIRDVLEVFRQAGEGLEAAHAVGLVHRDFKPDNVLIASDGRVLVTDFGLARSTRDATPSNPDVSVEPAQLTRTGAVLGTPAYMAPEQLAGEAVTSRSDVFSFCVALYEALYHERPFPGESVTEVRAAIARGEVREPPRATRVSPWLRRLLLGGLSAQPLERHESMKELLAMLSRDPAITRRARRRRALVATALMSFAAVSVAVGMGIRARVLARRQATELEEQARLGRELVVDLKDMEWFLRSAYLLPLHDVSREHAVVREGMARVAATHGSNSATRALVAYALGRGHLALHEYAQARARLDEARAGGLDIPELHYARGRTLGRLYQQEIAEAHHTSSDSRLKRRIQELDEEYLRPALASLDKSRGLRLESPSCFVDGLSALFRKDYDVAILAAEQARKEAPWRYEAAELEADIYLQRGTERRDRGDSDGGRRDLEEAAGRYDAAANIARSDARLYLGSAEAMVRLLRMNITGRAPPGDRVERAEERCRSAALVLPGSAEPNAKLAVALYFAGEDVRWRGKDPRPYYHRAIDAAARSLQIDDRSYGPRLTRSLSLTSEAAYEVEQGIDPTRALEQGIAEGRRLFELAPQLAHFPLGVAQVTLAQYQESVGIDPRATFRTAIDQFEAIGERRGEKADAWMNSLAAYLYWADYLVSRGESPDALSSAVRDTFAACLHENPNQGGCYANAGWYELALAQYQFDAGIDNEAQLKRAEDRFAKANELISGSMPNVQCAAGHDLLRERMSMRDGHGRAEAVAALGRSVAACYQLDSREPYCAWLEAEGALLAAIHGAGPPLSFARRLAAAAVKRNPHSADAAQVLAEIELHLADAPHTTHAERRRHVGDGLAVCAKGLAINPNHPRLLALSGALSLDDALSAPTAARAAAMVKGREALTRAFTLNPLLRREFGRQAGLQ